MSKSKAKTSAQPQAKTKKVVTDENEVALSRAHELKEKGNVHFARREHVQALALYAQALRMTPAGHPARALLHSNRAACYLRDHQYSEVVHECNQALEAAPKFGKALLRRARAYELQGDLPRALQDARVLGEDAEGEMSRQEVKGASAFTEEVREMLTRLEANMKSSKTKQRSKALRQANQTKVATSKAQSAASVVGSPAAAQPPMRKQVQPLNLKVSLGSDTRLVQVPGMLPFSDLLAAIRRKFPEEQGQLSLKYTDKESNLQTITSRQDLLTAVTQSMVQAQEKALGPAGLGGLGLGGKQPATPTPPLPQPSVHLQLVRETEGEEVVEFDDWLLDFAELFRSQLGIPAESQVDLHQQGLEKCNQALEAAVNSDKAVPLFQQAAAKFQEVAALALLNWGNVHMCQARRLFDSATGGGEEKKEGEAKEEDKPVLVTAEARAKAEEHYFLAQEKYKKALAMKEDFYEAVIASGQQLFERAKLLSSTEVTDKEKSKRDEEVEELFQAAQAKLKEALEIVPENAAVEGVVPEKKEDGAERKEEGTSGSKEEGKEEKKGEGEEASPPEDVLVRSQVLVMWGNVLYEQSQVRAQQGKKWESLLDEAVSKFREAKCSEDDIAGALTSHSGKKKEEEAKKSKSEDKSKTTTENPKKKDAKKDAKTEPKKEEQKKKPKSGKGGKK
mmetsp:Transcript_4833/g.6532  ORF Transcript_4833/g.6532 Transcript_4833/m.6532 type:complete len:677 (+) Transcript_4833:115-2145(+)|eukprot:CAMPEP_0196580284 /NCGR_PEP_ID=MMETSP1081-20130531/28272_1 /TAXON_ID=36882 /ORGANISM="Pyramimonas amylifera, Strain CCMP720" /LENGTH=676 /DNA_ID=CAMNT_0041900117 /DNA_START=115 /DNA_END=2145 /DNA_ORIENTATION=+